MARFRWYNAIRGMALLAVLLIVQTASLSHLETEGDGHPVTDTCVLCVGLATLGTANLPTAGMVLPAPAFERPPDYEVRAYDAVRTISILPRGPPGHV